MHPLMKESFVLRLILEMHRCSWNNIYFEDFVGTIPIRVVSVSIYPPFLNVVGQTWVEFSQSMFLTFRVSEGRHLLKGI